MKIISEDNKIDENIKENNEGENKGKKINAEKNNTYKNPIDSTSVNDNLKKGNNVKPNLKKCKKKKKDEKNDTVKNIKELEGNKNKVEPALNISKKKIKKKDLGKELLDEVKENLLKKDNDTIEIYKKVCKNKLDEVKNNNKEILGELNDKSSEIYKKINEIEEEIGKIIDEKNKDGIINSVENLKKEIEKYIKQKKEEEDRKKKEEEDRKRKEEVEQQNKIDEELKKKLIEEIEQQNKMKKTNCCAHNGCNAYISDVLYLLKGLKDLNIDKKLKKEESSEDSKEEKKEKKEKKNIKKKKKETKKEKKKKKKLIEEIEKKKKIKKWKEDCKSNLDEIEKYYVDIPDIYKEEAEKIDAEINNIKVEENKNVILISLENLENKIKEYKTKEDEKNRIKKAEEEKKRKEEEKRKKEIDEELKKKIDEELKKQRDEKFKTLKEEYKEMYAQMSKYFKDDFIFELLDERSNLKDLGICKAFDNIITRDKTIFIPYFKKNSEHYQNNHVLLCKNKNNKEKKDIIQAGNLDISLQNKTKEQVGTFLDENFIFNSGAIFIENEYFKYLRCSGCNSANCVSCKLRKYLEKENLLDQFISIYLLQGNSSNSDYSKTIKKIIDDGLKDEIKKKK